MMLMAAILMASLRLVSRIVGSQWLSSVSTLPRLCPPTNMSAHSGEKFGACFSSMPPNNPNDKWLISPQMTLGNNASIIFWVETYNTFYGLEQLQCGRFHHWQ